MVNLMNKINALISRLEITENFEDAFYLRKSYIFAREKSHDMRTQLGSIIVYSDTFKSAYFSGANTFPVSFHVRDVNDPNFSLVANVLKNISDKDWKKENIIHAEINSINVAKNFLESLNHTTLYVPDFPCANCTQNIIAEGIGRVVCHESLILKTPEHKIDSVISNVSKLLRFGVNVSLYRGELGGLLNLYDGVLWKP